MRGAVWVRGGDETSRQHAHHIQDGVALGVVLCSGLVDQDGVSIVLPVGWDHMRLIARVVETGSCQLFISRDGGAVHYINDDCLPFNGLSGRGKRLREHLL